MYFIQSIVHRWLVFPIYGSIQIARWKKSSPFEVKNRTKFWLLCKKRSAATNVSRKEQLMVLPLEHCLKKLFGVSWLEVMRNTIFLFLHYSHILEIWFQIVGWITFKVSASSFWIGMHVGPIVPPTQGPQTLLVFLPVLYLESQSLLLKLGSGRILGKKSRTTKNSTEKISKNKISQKNISKNKSRQKKISLKKSTKI